MNTKKILIMALALTTATCGFARGHHYHHHHHSGLHDIGHIVRDHLTVPDAVKEDIIAVYRLIAEAESVAHDMPVEEIHFHEVGTMDAIADVTAVCLLMHRLAPEKGQAAALRQAQARYIIRCTTCGSESRYVRRGRAVELMMRGRGRSLRCRRCGGNLFTLLVRRD